VPLPQLVYNTLSLSSIFCNLIKIIN